MQDAKCVPSTALYHMKYVKSVLATALCDMQDVKCRISTTLYGIE